MINETFCFDRDGKPLRVGFKGLFQECLQHNLHAEAPQTGSCRQVASFSRKKRFDPVKTKPIRP
jgi:hypothetical protein